MDNRTNTIAGWVLGAGIVALGASIVTAEMFHAERPEKMGYPIEGVTGAGGEEGGEAEQPIAALLAGADAAKGEGVFKKCAACHTINQGGAGGTGPNLWGVMGTPIGKHVPGYAYSPALAGKGGNWGWEEMSAWLKSPREFAPGTKMTFAGLGKAEDRANLLAYMNQQGGSPLPLPAVPAAAENPAQAAAEAADQPAAGDKGEDEPILNETQAATSPGRSVTGEGAPTAAGRSDQTILKKQ
ncbi:MAG TPA: cytochrome c family protein [Allosphingosinicella sp.]|nr:cytochrome c family protein [Allosphingosinicella sp.]